MYAVKVKQTTDKRWVFLSSGGRTNHLRIHAALFPTQERAQAVVDDIHESNDDWQAKVVTLYEE